MLNITQKNLGVNAFYCFILYILAINCFFMESFCHILNKNWVLGKIRLCFCVFYCIIILSQYPINLIPEMEDFNLLAEERHIYILEQLKQNGLLRSCDLKNTLHTSSETIRKDLEALEKQGLLKRVHGGARLPEDAKGADGMNPYIPYDHRKVQHKGEKCNIALRAADFIKEGQCIGLDSGTTTLEIAKILKERFQNLTIVTNSLATVMELSPCKGFTIICTGGVLRHDEYSFVTDLATSILSKLHIDVMFITATGISAQNGITDQRIDEVAVHSQMAAISNQVIVVADSSKFNSTSLVKVCEVDEVDLILTGRDLSEEALLESGIPADKIILCP